MRRIHLGQWAKAGAVVLGATLVFGCEGVEDVESGLEDGTEATSGEVEAPAPDLPSKRVGAGPNDVPGEYIVMMTPGADPRAVAASIGARPKHLFLEVLTGFAGPLDAGQIAALERRSEVELIEPDQVVRAAEAGCPSGVAAACGGFKTQIKQDMLYWGVDRVDQRELPFSNDYNYSCTGVGVPVYVFDTGIETSHSQFGGRASVDYDALGGDGQDCNGHGTHVAGLVAGHNYGVAKQAEVHSIRVLDCDGDGTFSKLLAGMDWLRKYGSKPAVANMSLSGFVSFSVNRAVNNLVESGVVVVAAAGNDGANACWFSPGGASRALTVAAANTQDTRASFSNYGSCVDIYAPGTNLKSAWLADGSRFASGTSMAAPHVAGVAAMYLQALANMGQSPSADQIVSDIESLASAGAIVGNPSGTPNLLVHWPCATGTNESVAQ